MPIVYQSMFQTCYDILRLGEQALSVGDARHKAAFMVTSIMTLYYGARSACCTVEHSRASYAQRQVMLVPLFTSRGAFLVAKNAVKELEEMWDVMTARQLGVPLSSPYFHSYKDAAVGAGRRWADMAAAQHITYGVGHSYRWEGAPVGHAGLRISVDYPGAEEDRQRRMRTRYRDEDEGMMWMSSDDEDVDSVIGDEEVYEWEEEEEEEDAMELD
jgi:hypothetical protein